MEAGIVDEIRLSPSNLPSIDLSDDIDLMLEPSTLYPLTKINSLQFRSLPLTKFKWHLKSPPKMNQMKTIQNGKIQIKRENVLIYLRSDYCKFSHFWKDNVEGTLMLFLSELWFLVKVSISHKTFFDPFAKAYALEIQKFCKIFASWKLLLAKVSASKVQTDMRRLTHQKL